MNKNGEVKETIKSHEKAKELVQLKLLKLHWIIRQVSRIFLKDPSSRSHWLKTEFGNRSKKDQLQLHSETYSKHNFGSLNQSELRKHAAWTVSSKVLSVKRLKDSKWNWDDFKNMNKGQNGWYIQTTYAKSSFHKKIISDENLRTGNRTPKTFPSFII